MNRRSAITTLSLTSLALLQAGIKPALSAPSTAATWYGLSDADLFAAFDYAANPALASVQKAAAAGDLPDAKKALADYLRARTTVPWDVSPRVADRASVKWNPKAADSAIRGDVVVVTVPHSYPSGEINWIYNATGGSTGLPSNAEWLWQLNRMEWWGALGKAYQATGDEKYADTWVKQLRSWNAQCPPPTKIDNGNLSAWRTIECGIRMQGIWPASYQTFLLSPSFTDDDIAAFVKTELAHARYLSANHTTGNWLTMEMNGLYGVAALFPEFAEATAWRKQAGDALYKELAVQFLPDGAQIELTPGYHNVALDNVLGLYTRALMVGHAGELPPDYVARMERAFDYDLYLMSPDRGLPKFNDSWSYNQIGRMTQAVKLFPDRTDFAFFASDGKAGMPPKETSHAFSYAGYYAMRDGWNRDASYAAFDAGPLGYGHTHQDKLNLVVWAYGRELLYDCGGGSYERSKYRSYATDTFSHNTVIVDGKPQRRQEKDRWANVSKAPIDASWDSTPEHDYVVGVYSDGYGSETNRIATHTRQVLFVKPGGGIPAFWIVADELKPNDTASHAYEARWSLLTTASGTDMANGIVVTKDAGHPNLAIIPLAKEGLQARAVVAQNEPEVLGWNVRKDTAPEYVPATTVVHARSGAGTQRFLTLLLPLKANAATDSVASVMPSPDGAKISLADGTGLVVTAGGARITVEATAVDGTKRRIAGGAP